MAKEIPWKILSEAYAFIGNSLLKPMTMTSTVGLDPAFWEAFPSFDDEAVAEAVAACARYAEGAVQRAEAGEDEPQRAAVEYTKLFVGPPSPAAAPWETMYRGKNVTVGFGQATFEMRELLREAGLEVRNVNNQYEDHLGIELLYLSSLCARADADAADAPRSNPWRTSSRSIRSAGSTRSARASPRRHPTATSSRLQGWLELCSPGMPKRCACRRLAWITLQRSIRPWVRSPSPATVRRSSGCGLRGRSTLKRRSKLPRIIPICRYSSRRAHGSNATSQATTPARFRP
mgnify:FL=1